MCGCNKDKETEPFDPYILYKAAYWSSREYEQIDGEDIICRISYYFEENGKYTYQYKRYSVDKNMGYSEKVYAESYKTGTYLVYANLIEFYPDDGDFFTAFWKYDEKSYKLTMDLSDGTTLELSGLFMLNY